MKRLLTILIVVFSLAFGASDVYAAPPAYTNIITNGSFTSGFSSWELNGNTVWDVADGVMNVSSTATTSTFHQITIHTATTGDKYELNLSLGNSSNATKSIIINIRDAGSSTGQIQCTFSIPSNSQLQHYRQRGVVGATFPNGVLLQFVINTHDSLPAILIDNIDLQLVPAAQHSTTICTSPTTTPTPYYTFTPSPTPTSTPAIALTWALPTQVIAGTPQPAQYVRFNYDISAGDVGVSMLLFALLLVLLSSFIIWLLIGRQRRRS